MSEETSNREWESYRQRILSKRGIKCETCKAGPKKSTLDAYHMGVRDYDPSDSESTLSVHIFCKGCHQDYVLALDDLYQSASWMGKEQVDLLSDISCDVRGEYLSGIDRFEVLEKLEVLLPMMRDFTVNELKQIKQTAFVFQSLGRRKAKDSE